MKLVRDGLEVRTDMGNPIGPRFIMGGEPPRIGFGPYGDADEAEDAREQWETYINRRKGSKELKKAKISRRNKLA
jgi:hypothetical protein